MAKALLSACTPVPTTRWSKRQKEHTIGVAVVVTNSYESSIANNPNWKPLKGTISDRSKWVICLEKLKFDVRHYTNLSKDDMKTLLSDINKLEMCSFDQGVRQHLLFVFCGHGLKENTEDGEEIAEKDVRDALTGNRCGTVVPKILFFDSCRGSAKDRGVDVSDVYHCSRGERIPETISNRGVENMRSQLVPTKGNYVVIRSTLPDHIAQETSGMFGNKFGLFSDLMTRYLPERSESLSNIVAMVNGEMSLHCPKLIKMSSEASFQLAEFTGAPIGHINLFEEARKMTLLQPPPLPPSESAAPLVLHRAHSVPMIPADNPTLTAKQIFNNYFRYNKEYKSVAIIEEKEKAVDVGFVFTIKVTINGVEYLVESGICHKKEEAKEDASLRILNALTPEYDLPLPKTPPVKPITVGPPPRKTPAIYKAPNLQVGQPFPTFPSSYAHPTCVITTPPPVLTQVAATSRPVPSQLAATPHPVPSQSAATPRPVPSQSAATPRPVPSQVAATPHPVPFQVAATPPVPPLITAREIQSVSVEKNGKNNLSILNEFKQKFENTTGSRVTLSGEPTGSEGAFSCVLTLEVVTETRRYQLSSDGNLVAGSKKAAKENGAMSLVRKLIAKRILYLA